MDKGTFSVLMPDGEDSQWLVDGRIKAKEGMPLEFPPPLFDQNCLYNYLNLKFKINLKIIVLF